MSEQYLNVWTDGAYSSATDCGGWAYIIMLPNNVFYEVVSGSECGTTSQRMELTALLMALRALPTPRYVAVHTDSSYLKNCFMQKWHVKWCRRGWINSKGEPVANRDLWEVLIPQVERHTVKWVKVKGHRGVEYNEMVDRAAVAARKKLADELRSVA